MNVRILCIYTWVLKIRALSNISLPPCDTIWIGGQFLLAKVHRVIRQRRFDQLANSAVLLLAKCSRIHNKVYTVKVWTGANQVFWFPLLTNLCSLIIYNMSQCNLLQVISFDSVKCGWTKYFLTFKVHLPPGGERLGVFLLKHISIKYKWQWHVTSLFSLQIIYLASPGRHAVGSRREIDCGFMTSWWSGKE